VATPSGKRAFWMHQAAEYIMGAVFVAQGLQSPTPLIPSVCGGLVMLNTACAKGPLSAFRVFGRRTHRMLDAVVIAVIIVMTVQPVISIDSSTRAIMAVLAFVLGFVWIQSDFSESARTSRRAGTDTASTDSAGAAGEPSPSPSSANAAGSTRTPRAASRPANATMADTVGRTAGRLAGRGVNIYREQAAKRRKK
jgi:hypothetical protein